MCLLATIVDTKVLESLSLIKENSVLFSYHSVCSFVVSLKSFPYLLYIHK